MRGHRPKLSTLFSNRNVPTVATPEPPQSTLIIGREWSPDEPPSSRLDPNVELMAQSLLSTLLANPHTALSPELNHFILYIIEAYQKEVGNRHTLENTLTNQIQETTALRKRLSELRIEHEETKREIEECHHEMKRLRTELMDKDRQMSDVLRQSMPVLGDMNADIYRTGVARDEPQDALTRRLSEAIIATPKAGTLGSVSNQPDRESELSRLFKTVDPSTDNTDFRPGLPVTKAPIDTTLPTSFAMTEEDADEKPEPPEPPKRETLPEDVSSSFSSTDGDFLDDECYNGSNILDIVDDNKDSRQVLKRLAHEMARRQNITTTEAIECLNNVVLTWAKKEPLQPSEGLHTPLLAIKSEATTPRRTSYTPGDDSTFRHRARSIKRDDATHTTLETPTQLDFIRSPISPFSGRRTSNLSSLLDPSPDLSDQESSTRARAKENERRDEPRTTRSNSPAVRTSLLSPAGSASSTVRKASTASRIPHLQSPTRPIRRPAARRNRQSSNSSIVL